MPERARTPVHLWIVGVIALLWNAMGAMDYLMTEMRNESYMAKFSQEQLDYYYAFPSWLVAAWAIAVWGGLLGSVLLLLRKKLATPVFLVSLVAMVVTTIYNYGISNGMDVMGGAGALGFTALIFIISVLLFVYARAMQQRQVLN